MRLQLLIVTSLLLLNSQVASGESPACAVRLQASLISDSHALTALDDLLVRLPTPPLAVHNLLQPHGDSRPAARDSREPQDAVDKAVSGRVSRALVASWRILRFRDISARDRAVAILRQDARVEVVEAVQNLRLSEVGQVVPIGSIREEVPWNVERVGAPEAWELIEPDTSLIVAIIDTGADLSHPDLIRRLWHNDDPPGNATSADDLTDQNGDGFIEDWERDDDDDNGYVDDEYGFDFTDAPGQDVVGDATGRDADPNDENGHGTHVAGIVAADGALKGVAPFVRVMPVRAAFNTPFGGGVLETDDAAAAIVYAVDNGARILNLSWGDREESRLVREAIDYAVDRGVLVVAAAGNANSDEPHYPSGDPRVLAVSSVDRSGRRSLFSNFGAGVDIAAPGEEFQSPGAGIISLEPLNLEPSGFGSRRGTSMAAPHVVGAAAIVMSRADGPDARGVRALLLASARRRNPDDWTTDLAHGEVDAAAAVRSVDDLVVSIQGPVHPYRLGRVQLRGTVLSGDLLRLRIDAQHVESGQSLELLPWQTGQRISETLVDRELEAIPPGLWEYVVAAETVTGRRRERHGHFVVDRSVPQVDTLFADAAWRGAVPTWLLSARLDDAVEVRVERSVDTLAVLASAGYSSSIQLEGAAVSAVGSAWRVIFENSAGLQTEVSLSQPPVLEPWPRGANLRRLDASTSFFPEALSGIAPDGTHIVWGRGLETDRFTTMQSWRAENERLRLHRDTGLTGRPVAFADANGDGAEDLLYQDGRNIVWLLSRAAGLFPDSTGGVVVADRALGFHQLDEDAAAEALLSSNDSLFIYDDAAGRSPEIVQVLENPSNVGFNVWGADAAVGDLDVDGSIEIACGDGEGFVAIFERPPGGEFALQQSLDSQGTYAYDLTRLPEGGFLVGRQRSESVTGDGFSTAVYEFVHYAAGPVEFERQRTYPILSPENSLRSGSSLFQSSATGAYYLALVRGEHLYLASGNVEPRAQVSYLDGALGEAPVLADLDDDGVMELVLRSARGAELFELAEAWRGPHSLVLESLGVAAVHLTWVSGDGEASRILRAQAGVWQILGETSAAQWTDSTVVPWVTYEYRVESLVSGSVRGTTASLEVRAQPRPRLSGVVRLGSASLRLTSTNALRAQSVAPHRFQVFNDSGRAWQVVQATLSDAGRGLDLTLATALECGDIQVRADSLRDTQGGLLEPPHSALELTVICELGAFFVREVEREGSSIVVEFSRQPAAQALEVATYSLTWDGVPVSLARAESIDTRRVRLLLAPGAELVGRGIPYLLQLDPALRAFDDGVPLAAAATQHAIHVQGKGAAALFVYPNPVRVTDAAVVFAEVAPGTRVWIYNLEGELVRELSEVQSGGLRWDLTTNSGRRIRSGAYIYVARDASGKRRGRLVIQR